jgi:neuropeptide S receptor
VLFSLLQTEQITVLWILFVLIVLGNSAVLAALLLDNKGRKSRMNFFIMHLAFAGEFSANGFPFALKTL